VVAPSKTLIGPFLGQLFHRKRGRLTRLKGLRLQVGLLRPGDPPAFGAEYMQHPM